MAFDPLRIHPATPCPLLPEVHEFACAVVLACRADGHASAFHGGGNVRN